MATSSDDDEGSQANLDQYPAVLVSGFDQLLPSVTQYALESSIESRLRKKLGGQMVGIQWLQDATPPAFRVALKHIQDVEKVLSWKGLKVKLEPQGSSASAKYIQPILDVTPEVSDGCALALSPGFLSAISVTTHSLSAACKQSGTTLSRDGKRIIAQAPDKLVLFQDTVMRMLGYVKPNALAAAQTVTNGSGSDAVRSDIEHSAGSALTNGRSQPADSKAAPGGDNAKPDVITVEPRPWPSDKPSPVRSHPEKHPEAQPGNEPVPSSGNQHKPSVSGTSSVVPGSAQYGDEQQCSTTDVQNKQGCQGGTRDANPSSDLLSKDVLASSGETADQATAAHSTQANSAQQQGQVTPTTTAGVTGLLTTPPHSQVTTTPPHSHVTTIPSHNHVTITPPHSQVATGQPDQHTSIYPQLPERVLAQPGQAGDTPTGNSAEPVADAGEHKIARAHVEYHSLTPVALDFLKSSAGKAYVQHAHSHLGLQIDVSSHREGAVFSAKSSQDIAHWISELKSSAAEHAAATPSSTSASLSQERPVARVRDSRPTQQPHGGTEVRSIVMTPLLAEFLHSTQGNDFIQAMVHQNAVRIALSQDRSSAIVTGSSLRVVDYTVDQLNLTSAQYKPELDATGNSRRLSGQRKQLGACQEDIAQNLADNTGLEPSPRRHTSAPNSAMPANDDGATRKHTSNFQRPASSTPPLHHSEAVTDTSAYSATNTTQGSEQKRERWVDASPATTAFMKSDEGCEFMDKLTDETGVEFYPSQAGKARLLVCGSSDQLLDNVLDKLNTLAHSTATGQPPAKKPTHEQHSARQPQRANERIDQAADQLESSAASQRRVSPEVGQGRFGITRNSRGPEHSERQTGAAGATTRTSSHPAARPAPKVHEEAISGHETVLKYMKDEYNLDAIAKQYGCQLSFSSDGSQLIIKSQSKTALQKCFEAVEGVKDNVEEHNMAHWRIPAVIPTSMYDRLLADVSNKLPSVSCYIEKRNFVALVASGKEAQYRRKYDSVIEHWKKNGIAGPGEITLQDPPPPGYETVIAQDVMHTSTSSRAARVPTAGLQSRYSRERRPDPSPVLEEAHPQAAWKKSTPSTRTYQNGATLSIHQGDITGHDVNIIVSAANGKLVPAGGVAGAIAHAGGTAIETDAKRKLRASKKSTLPAGDIMTTTAGQLRCRNVIHAIGPDCRGEIGQGENDRLLRLAVLHTLQEAALKLKAKSIAFPAISSGTYGMAPSRCARVMLNTMNDFCSLDSTASRPVLTDIRIVLFDSGLMGAFQAALGNLKPHTTMPHVQRGQSVEEEVPRHTDGVEEIPGATPRHVARGRAAPGLRTASADIDRCPCCREDLDTLPRVTTLPCQHQVCKECITELKRTSNEKCPLCSKAFGSVVGPQPEGGKMTVAKMDTSLPGHYGCGTIKITYTIPAGTQTSRHPNPGFPYPADRRDAYLPDSPKGVKVARLLRKAFQAGEIFTVGHSATRGVNDVVTWNDIHHKTSRTAGDFGYPDPGYLDRVTGELAARGIE
ncbi:uncharacterized protein LOC135815725 [Sycon ciliatum]|uniref:uncharacterized protein LOC135815725 n=1 Tax=Sycon ciliatum TaxID=27933 RepID=UPI0031F60E94